MTQQLIILSVMIGGVLAIIQMIGVMIYDVQSTRRQRFMKLHPFTRRLRQRPQVTVIVLAHNSAADIAACLQSISAQTYRKVDIIVADNASKDDTRRIVNQLQKQYRQLRVYAKRRSGNQEQLVSAAYQRSRRGQVVMIVPASRRLSVDTIRRAVDQLNYDPKLDGLRLQERLFSQYSLTGLLQQFDQLFSSRSLKMRSAFGSLRPTALEAQVVRREMVSDQPSVGQWQYAEDVIVQRPAANHFGDWLLQRYRAQILHMQWQRSLRWWQQLHGAFSLVFAAAVPVLLTYCVYLAINLRQPTLLLMSWLVVAGWLLLLLWDDHFSSWRSKLGQSLLIPVSYGVFYIISCIHLLAIIRRSLWWPRPVR